MEKKKIHVNAASLVDLKAALFRKQQEVKHQGGSNSLARSSKVSDKTASIWRKQPKKVAATARSSSTTSQDLPSIEEMDLARSRAALEAKAALYDKLSREGNPDSSDDDEDKPMIMVDFQKKIYDQVLKERSQKSVTTTDTPLTDNEPVASEEEWVDYTDSLGRSRRCLKKDLPKMLKIDEDMEYSRSNRSSGSSSPDLMSEDMRKERERQQWEEEAYVKPALKEYYDEEVDDQVKKNVQVHYQTVKHKEVRNVGVGYYSFDVDEEKRAEQMNMLNTFREETKDQRSKREKIKEKRKSILEAKLAKIKQRKLKQKGDTNEDDSNKLNIADFEFEKDPSITDEGNKTEGVSNDPLQSLGDLIGKQVNDAREKAEEEERLKHKRLWDRGKVTDPIYKQKKQLQEERLTEFAPPSVYKPNRPSPSSSLPPPPPPPPPFPPPQPPTQPPVFPPPPYYYSYPNFVYPTHPPT